MYNNWLKWHNFVLDPGSHIDSVIKSINYVNLYDYNNNDSEEIPPIPGETGFWRIWIHVYHNENTFFIKLQIASSNTAT